MLTEKHPDMAAAPASQLAERKRMAAQLSALNDALLSQASATAVLQALCDRRAPTSPRIRARKILVPDIAGELPAVRRQLDVTDHEPVRRRRVELICGDAVLCRADNWYLPNRLTDEMNAQLLNTEIPFGVVVQALAFRRRTLSSSALFEPLPAGWLVQSSSELNAHPAIPEDVLEHRAILETSGARSFSLLLEIYTKQIFTA